MKNHPWGRTAVLFSIALVIGVCAAAWAMALTHLAICAAATGGIASFAVVMAWVSHERNYRASLAERAAQPVQPEIMWEVRMNDVQVAHISDSEMAALQDEVASDWRTWVSQFLNLLRVPFSLLDKLVIAVPGIAFWLILGYAVFAPDALIQDFTAIRNASPTELQRGLSQGLTILLTCCMIAVSFNWLVFGASFGARNVASEEFGNRLRRRLKIAATGTLTISRIADGRRSGYSPDFFGWLRWRLVNRRAASKA